MTAHLKGLQAFQERLELYGDDIAMWEINEALQAYLEASGMVMVPREPTDRMKTEADRARNNALYQDENDQIGALNIAIEAAIAAAPSPFSQANTEEDSK